MQLFKMHDYEYFKMVNISMILNYQEDYTSWTHTPKSVNYNLECIINKMDGLLARIIYFVSNTRARILLYNIIQMITHGHEDTMYGPILLWPFVQLCYFCIPCIYLFCKLESSYVWEHVYACLFFLTSQNVSKSKCLIFKVFEKWPISQTKIGQITKNISMYLFNCFCGGCLLATWVKQATCTNAINTNSL